MRCRERSGVREGRCRDPVFGRDSVGIGVREGCGVGRDVVLRADVMVGRGDSVWIRCSGGMWCGGMWCSVWAEVFGVVWGVQRFRGSEDVFAVGGDHAVHYFVAGEVPDRLVEDLHFDGAGVAGGVDGGA